MMKKPDQYKGYFVALACTMAIGLQACTVTHRIEPSDKPMVINLNVNIKQEIRVKLEKDIEDMLANNPDIF